LILGIVLTGPVIWLGPKIVAANREHDEMLRRRNYEFWEGQNKAIDRWQQESDEMELQEWMERFGEEPNEPY